MTAAIADFLLAHACEDPVSFHMPGHKGAEIYRRFGYDKFLNNIMDCDITEITGADNLFQAEGIIREAQEKYAELYGAENSYLLVNGTSGGIIAAILAAVPHGKKLIMARNSHKSVFNALVLGDIEPIYAYPELIDEYGISGEVRADEIERLLAENTDAAAVILPSPNYYGICSDIQAIAEVVHKAGKVLIVDQAHGAHLKFWSRFGDKTGERFELPMPISAEDGGADIVINSIHKTLASFTQSAVLNLNSDRVDRYILEDKLQAIESSSPSYLLMAALDISREMIESHGRELIKEWSENLEFFYREAAGIEGLCVIGNPYAAKTVKAPKAAKTPKSGCISETCTCIQSFDLTKINLDMSACGLSGEELEALMIKDGIYCELVTGNILMCMTGIGNRRCDYERLLAALRRIAAEHSGKLYELENGGEENISRQSNELRPIPKYKVRKKLSEAVGYVSAASIIPYPPGIPLICPGEVITAETAEYIINLRKSGKKVIGVNENFEVFVEK